MPLTGVTSASSAFGTPPLARDRPSAARPASPRSVPAFVSMKARVAVGRGRLREAAAEVDAVDGTAVARRQEERAVPGRPDEQRAGDRRRGRDAALGTGTRQSVRPVVGSSAQRPRRAARRRAGALASAPADRRDVVGARPGRAVRRLAPEREVRHADGLVVLPDRRAALLVERVDAARVAARRRRRGPAARGRPERASCRRRGTAAPRRPGPARPRPRGRRASSARCRRARRRRRRGRPRTRRRRSPWSSAGPGVAADLHAERRRAVHVPERLARPPVDREEVVGAVGEVERLAAEHRACARPRRRCRSARRAAPSARAPRRARRRSSRSRRRRAPRRRAARTAPSPASRSARSCCRCPRAARRGRGRSSRRRRARGAGRSPRGRARRARRRCATPP